MYGLPPPGIVYITARHPTHGMPNAQYSTPQGFNSNGYPPLPHNLPYAAAHPSMPFTSQYPAPPPLYQVDPSWYKYEPPSSASQLIVPNNATPPGLIAPIPSNSACEGNSTTLIADNPHIHEFWRGRLAPLPGYHSRPVLLPAKQFACTNSEKREEESHARELLPPHTFFGPGFERNSNPSSQDNFTALKNNTKTTEKNEKIKKEFQFDTYAESFVPQYLYDIQKQSQPLKALPPLAIFPSISYLKSFLIPRLIEESLKYDNLSLLMAPPLPKDSKLPVLDINHYHDHWRQIIRWELDAVSSEKEQIVLWKMKFQVAVWKDSEFVLSVPGIRENHPYLEVGDLVHMREVIESEKRGSNRAVEGRVVALRKREGLVHITSPPLREHVQTYVPLTLENIKTENGYVVFGPDDVIPFTFNVSFLTNARPFCLMDASVTAVASVLSSNDPGTNLARRWLFPEPEDLTVAPSVVLQNGVIGDSQWVDHGLNDEQRLAVTSVALYQSPVPHLIGGPPGTGKTRTVVEAVNQIFRIQPEACILLCAPSNPATDTLVLRLQNHLLQDEMLRLNDPNRTFAEVPDSIKPYCYVENDKFSIPPWKILMKYRVVVCSCLDASILVGAQCTNLKLMAMEEEMTSTVHPHRSLNSVVQPHWTHLLIDEAAQGSEPELLIPISVVLPDVFRPEVLNKVFMPQLALCGDIHQLGPIVVSSEARSAELEVSLLERLFERPLYSRCTQDMEIYGKPHRLLQYTTLAKNYRSHPVILMPPSAIFYNDTLQPFAINGRVFWKGLASSDFPLKFIGTLAPDKSVDERASWYNPGQINVVVEVVKSLLDNARASDPPLRIGEISVMAPWRRQVWMLRKRLRNEGFSAVDVGTVEDYQGRESRVVIISCVRSNSRFLEEDYKKGMGLIFERKRMNVAITRAKELLIVIGNGALLQRDPYWKSFLQFTLRNGLYEGPELSLEMDGIYVSRLESELFEARKASTCDPEKEGLALAAGMAREVLRE